MPQVYVCMCVCMRVSAHIVSLLKTRKAVTTRGEMQRNERKNTLYSYGGNEDIHYIYIYIYIYIYVYIHIYSTDAQISINKFFVFVCVHV